MADDLPLLTRAGAPEYPPRPVSLLIKIAPLTSGVAAGGIWALVLAGLHFGLLTLIFSDTANVVSKAWAITGITMLVISPLALWVYMRGVRARVKEFGLLRNGALTVGHVADSDTTLTDSLFGQKVVVCNFRISYLPDEDKVSGIQRYIYQQSMDGGADDMEDVLARVNLHKDSVPVFYDPQNPANATTPINLCCKFTDRGVAVADSHSRMWLRLSLGPGLSASVLLAMVVLSIWRLVG